MAGPECEGLTDLFYSPELDGRTEEGRSEREALCKDLCYQCGVRLPCLEKALVWKEDQGVWGGMGEGERRRFVAHLKREGYRDEVPTGLELEASLRQFYSQEGNGVALNLFPRRRRAS